MMLGMNENPREKSKWSKTETESPFKMKENLIPL